jgi:predicted membrane channel-forming protein YqfA (hemolysin III family)
MGTVGVAVFANQMDATSLDSAASFSRVLFVKSSVTFLAGVLVYISLQSVKSKDLSIAGIKYEELKFLFKNQRL